VPAQALVWVLESGEALVGEWVPEVVLAGVVAMSELVPAVVVRHSL